MAGPLVNKWLCIEALPPLISGELVGNVLFHLTGIHDDLHKALAHVKVSGGFVVPAYWYPRDVDVNVPGA